LPLETALAGTPGLESTRSFSRNGFAQITAVFTDRTDIYFARQQVVERLNEAKTTLPPGVELRMGPISTGLGEVYWWSVEYAPPGEGAPLVDDDPNAGERWAARHVAKNANVRPEFVELRHEIADRRDRLVRRLRAHRLWLEDRAALVRDLPAERILDAARATTEFDSRVESELRGAMGEINALVARHNLKVPLALQIPALSLEHLRGRT